jgi:hypothetical protein
VHEDRHQARLAPADVVSGISADRAPANHRLDAALKRERQMASSHPEALQAVMARCKRGVDQFAEQ